MPRRMHLYEFLFFLGVLFIAGTIGAMEMSSISETRMVFQAALGLFIAIRYGVKSLQLFCRRADR